MKKLKRALTSGQAVYYYGGALAIGCLIPVDDMTALQGFGVGIGLAIAYGGGMIYSGRQYEVKINTQAKLIDKLSHQRQDWAE